MAEIAVCPDPKKLAELLHGAASLEEIDSFAQHLETCSTCAQRIEETDASSPMLHVMRQSAQTSPLVVDGRMQAMMDRLDRMISRPGDPQQMTATPCPNSREVQTSVEGNGNTDADTERDYVAWLEPAQDASEVGRLGAYRILKILGVGGMGVVYQAEDTTLKRTVALKAMKPSLASNNSARQRFLREAQTAAAVRHDNVVTIYQAGEHNQIAFLAMEYLEGESLEDRLKRETRLTVAETLRIGREIAEGLVAAHAHDLIHRDIKPSNLWLEQGRSRVKILDFGLARAAVGNVKLTQSGTILGTAAYMAPEQAEGEPVDGRADLFGLGCVLYRMATGEMPFKGGGVMQILRAIAITEPRKPHEVNPEIPNELSELIMKLLAKRSSDRPASAEQVIQHLRIIESAYKPAAAFVADRTSIESAVPSSLGAIPTSARPSFQGRPSWLMPVGLLLALTLGIVAYFQPNGKQPALDSAWLKQVAALPAAAQVEAVAAKLKERNPAFDGQVTPVFDERGVVTRLTFLTDNVTDIAPVAALTGLRELSCCGSGTGSRSRGQLADLSPLKGMKLTQLVLNATRVSDLSPLKEMKLTYLYCNYTKVSDLSPLQGMESLRNLVLDDTPVADLSPLKGMKLRFLACSGSKVSDLSPLKDMKLTFLSCGHTKVADLSPLKDMKLTDLHFENTAVSDLSPLRGMPLTQLHFTETKVADLSPLKGMPLKEILCTFNKGRDADILRSLKTLERINGKSAAEFWKEVDQKKP